MKTGLILSIREKSTRYPGKVLKEFHGQTVTEHLIDRLKMAKGFEKLIIGTSDDPRDKVFEQFATRKGIEVFFGSQEDKLKRYLQVCNYYNLDSVVIVDGDDILCFPEICTITAEEIRDSGYDVIFWDGLPVGAASSGITKDGLLRIMELKDESDTEVWGGYFRQSSEFSILDKTVKGNSLYGPTIRMTLDYEEDFIFFKKIFDEL